MLQNVACYDLSLFLLTSWNPPSARQSLSVCSIILLVFSVMMEMVWWQVCQSAATYVSLLCDGGNGVMASLSQCVSPSSDRGNHATDGASSWVCRDPGNFLRDDWGWCQGFHQQADQTPQRLCYLQWWVLRSAIHTEAPYCLTSSSSCVWGTIYQ